MPSSEQDVGNEVGAIVVGLPDVPTTVGPVSGEIVPDSVGDGDEAEVTADDTEEILRRIALVFGPTAPYPVVAGEPEETMLCLA